MLKTSEASEGLLFGSFLFRKDLFSLEQLTKLWETQFGKSFSLIPEHNPLNAYYSKEMGPELSRVFFLTSSQFSRDHLLSAKLLSMDWEQNWSVDGKRMVNVDIGFLSLENFLLATTKNYSHRVFIGQNIFADLTLYFHQGELQSLPWTYPDFLDSQKKDFLLWGRSFLLGLKNK
jgi:hypothetical protein